MKRRQGFVSNSSSSSFICDVSGCVEGGYDLGLYDAGMYECENGHTFYEHYIEGSVDDAVLTYNIDWHNSERMTERIDLSECTTHDQYEELTGVSINDDDFRYSVPAHHCPICSLSHVPDRLLLDYVTKVTGTSEEEYRKIIKVKFNSIDELKSFKG